MSRRPYDSTRRRDQAASTKAAVLEAGRALFVERGYSGTTVAEIASTAGVAPATVNAAFGGKAGLLKRLVDVAIVGDDEPVPVGERQVAADVAASDDPAEQLALLAAFVTAAHGRFADLFDLMSQASGADPEVLADLERLQRGRRDGMGEFVTLVAPGALPEGLDAERAADIVWALTEPRIYRGLVHERGWRPDDYQGWLVEQLTNALLRPA